MPRLPEHSTYIQPPLIDIDTALDIRQPSRLVSIEAQRDSYRLTPLPDKVFATIITREPLPVRYMREVSEEIIVRHPSDVSNYLRQVVYTPWESCTQEELYGLVINTARRITHDYMVSRGTIDMTPIRIADFFRPAIIANAAGVVVSHNHPSGVAEPSPQDVMLTRELIKAGNLLGIEVIDHVIIGKNTFTSLKERGLGFGSS